MRHPLHILALLTLTGLGHAGEQAPAAPRLLASTPIGGGLKMAALWVRPLPEEKKEGQAARNVYFKAGNVYFLTVSPAGRVAAGTVVWSHLARQLPLLPVPPVYAATVAWDPLAKELRVFLTIGRAPGSDCRVHVWGVSPTAKAQATFERTARSTEGLVPAAPASHFDVDLDTRNLLSYGVTHLDAARTGRGWLVLLRSAREARVDTITLWYDPVKNSWARGEKLLK